MVSLTPNWIPNNWNVVRCRKYIKVKIICSSMDSLTLRPPPFFIILTFWFSFSICLRLCDAIAPKGATRRSVSPGLLVVLTAHILDQLIAVLLGDYFWCNLIRNSCFYWHKKPNKYYFTRIYLYFGDVYYKNSENAR